MSTAQGFKQAPHNLLLIPGPVEVSDDVLFANAHPSNSHMAPDFTAAFGDCIRMMRELLYTKDGQIFLIAGSGTLGWDQVSANLIEAGEHVLLLNTGFFGDRFAECLSAYGANVDQIKAPLGGTPTLEEVEKALTSKHYKAITITHVDTSTGVLSDAKAISALVQRVSPQTLVILDAVCAVASEEIRFDDWGLDVVISASQKGIGCPPGLSIACASKKALQVYETRKTPVAAYYASWKQWLPVMHSYEKGSPLYFATPPVNLIYALQATLLHITKGSIALPERFCLHKEISQRVRGMLQDCGLKLVPHEASIAANGMTAVYYSEGMSASDIIPKMAECGLTIAAGVHPAFKDKYFRIGHMGITVEPERHDIDQLIAALQNVLS